MNNNTDTVIIGLGETGFSCVQHYAAQGIPVIVMDSRENPSKLVEFKKEYPHIPFNTGVFPKEILAKVKTLILSPGISQDHPDIRHSLSPQAEIIGDIELLARNITAPVVAITGSNGKSTVTTLVGEMAKAAGIRVGVGGNLGTPVLALLKEKPDLYVLELSSFQLETTHSLKPKVATVLNICPDHLDRYTSLDAYQAAKHRIFKNCESIVYNREDPHPKARLVNHHLQQTISFGMEVPPKNHYGLIKNKEVLWLTRGKELLLPASKLKISGRHNLANALAALALGESIALSMASMLSVLQSFPGLSHRAEWVSDHLGVPWINDSKGTNVGATLATLEGLSDTISGKWVLIAGGIGKNADFSPLVPVIQQHCKAVILIGEATETLYSLLHDVVHCIRATDMTDAVQKAADCVKLGDGVLLSPICASYDMFKNFEDRGNVFKSVVMGSIPLTPLPPF
jgi:UDP-N-acetylmuramoylalanine--D-glutamate ligase